MKRYIQLFLIIVSLLYLNQSVAGQGTEELFQRANMLYNESKYSDALELYLKIIASGAETGDLLYNTGNCCFRLGMTGHAVLYYQRALRIMPDDADLRYNLKYVLAKTKDAVEPGGGILDTVFLWNSYIPLTWLVVIFIIINAALWTFLAVRIFMRRDYIFYLIVVFGIAWVVSGSSMAAGIYSYYNDNRAVIISEEADVLSGPFAGDAVLFKLHAGTIAEHLKDENGYGLVTLSDGKRGWILRKDFERIR